MVLLLAMVISGAIGIASGFPANPLSLRGVKSNSSVHFPTNLVTSSQGGSHIPGYEASGGFGLPSINCYSGHGGKALPPDDGLRPMRTVTDCAARCDDDTGCSCFVFMYVQNKCFLRSECFLDNCEKEVPGTESVEFDTFISVAKKGQSCSACEHGEGHWTPYGGPALACVCDVCEPGYKSEDVLCVPGSRDYSYTFKDYDQHAHVNCYDGHGGTAGSSDLGFRSGLLASDCVKACDVDANCSCFVYNWSQKQCFLLSECQLDQCEVGEEGGESNQFETFIKNGRGA